MKLQRIYCCEASVDGIFTAIYDAWDSHYGHDFIKIKEINDSDTMELFSEYVQVKTNADKAEKVALTIQKKISDYAYEVVIKSALSIQNGRADAIYKFLQLGLFVGESVMEQLSHPYVLPLFEMERRVNFEVLHYKQFVRFSELENKILFSKIRPENDILSLVTPHFEDRFPEENFIIYDAGRNCAAVHRKDYPWIMADAAEMNLAGMENYSKAEIDMQYFWQTFVDTIGIQDRCNKKLQYQMLPNRYREFMRELPYRGRK